MGASIYENELFSPPVIFSTRHLGSRADFLRGRSVGALGLVWGSCFFVVKYKVYCIWAVLGAARHNVSASFPEFLASVLVSILPTAGFGGHRNENFAQSSVCLEKTKDRVWRFPASESILFRKS